MTTKRPADFDYHAYLASREWSLLREEVRKRSGDKCEHCFVAPQQAVHHLTYERIGHEELEDLMAVCNPCHEYFSGKSDDDPAYIYVVSPPFKFPSACFVGHYLIPRCDVNAATSPVRFVSCGTSIPSRKPHTPVGCVWCPGQEMWHCWLPTLVLR